MHFRGSPGNLEGLTVVGLALPGRFVSRPGLDGDGLVFVEGESVRRCGAEPRVLFPGGKDPQTDHVAQLQSGQIQRGFAVGGIQGLRGGIPRIHQGNGRVPYHILYAPNARVFQRDGHHAPVGQGRGGNLGCFVDLGLPVQDHSGIGLAAGQRHRVHLIKLFRAPERNAAPAVRGGQKLSPLPSFSCTRVAATGAFSSPKI